MCVSKFFDFITSQNCTFFFLQNLPNMAFRIDPLPLPTGPTIAVNFPFFDSKVIFSKVLTSSFSFHFPLTSVSLMFPGPVN